MKKYFPLIIILIIFYTAIFDTLFLSLKKTDGKFVYPLDDAYIHMAIAKNFAKHNVWGMTKYEFSSSSSSPLWTFVLSIFFKIFGVHDIIPFVLNLLCATYLIIFVYKVFLKFISSLLFIFLFILFLIFAIPLPTMVFLGMEHTLHCLLCTLTLYIFSYHIINNPSKKDIIKYLFLITLCGGIRYENMFFIFAIILVLLSLKKYNLSFLTLLCGAFPIVLVGIVQKIHGWFFFPTSIILKGNRIELDLATLHTLFKSLYYNLPYLQWLFLLFILSSIIFLKNIFQKKYFLHENIWSFVFILTCILHTSSKPSGLFWFYRYEAYLCAIGVIGLILGTSPDKFLLALEKLNSIKRSFMITFILILTGVFGSLFAERIISCTAIPQTSQNIYHQQYQMGLFLKEFYEGKKVALNDIGAVCYLADIKLLDLWGLASKESARNKLRTKSYHSISSCNNKLLLDFIYNWTKKEKCEIAVIYEKWFEGQTSKWIKVGAWQIQNNMVCAFDTVSFYAVDILYKDKLIRNLRSFSKKLPSSVKQYGIYLQE